jgi:uracil-DNA glycosylase family 4
MRMAPADPHSSLDRARRAIVQCRKCARLRSYCERIAREKKAAYRDDEYWGRPVPGFGDPGARVLILGLAPAAHGANRTGRVFTGDGPGGSGDFLMAALNRAGFANIPTSRRPDDGLRLAGVYIAAAVRCAPPDNRPLPSELAACAGHLDAEVAALPGLRVVVALGRVAWDAWLAHLARRGVTFSPRPRFAHGATIRYPLRGGSASSPADARELARATGILVGCYHPSRQNTNTGKVTPAMYDDVFQRIVRAALAR